MHAAGTCSYVTSATTLQKGMSAPAALTERTLCSGLANNALAMRSDTADAEAFSQDVIVSLAKGQRTRTAKAIGYMINANSTYGGGGCDGIHASLHHILVSLASKNMDAVQTSEGSLGPDAAQ